jgi:hypothetical protein
VSGEWLQELIREVAEDKLETRDVRRARAGAEETRAKACENPCRLETRARDGTVKRR